MQNEQKEIWKDIPGYEGLYQASNLGNIKSLNYNKKGNEHILKNSFSQGKYFQVTLHKDGKQKTFKSHQLVAMAFLGHKICGMKLVVNHKNFIRTDNRVENLEIVTSRENANQKHLKSSSKYTGVSWEESRKKWVAQIIINRKVVKLGRFKNEIDASNAYQNKLKEINN
jgi:hypothetical protein